MARLLPLLVLCFALLSCGGAPEEADIPWTSYPIEGTVVQLNKTDQVAVIDHGPIGDWMGAMKMGFPVRDAAEFAKLSEGAKIKGTVQAKGHMEYFLEGIEVLADEAPEGLPE